MAIEQGENLLQKNFFELFGLSAEFEVDGAALAERYRDLQRVLHPDRFAHASPEQQRLSVQQTAHINEAMATIKSPLNRARYLLEQKGVDMDDTDTRMDHLFLMDQIELHEKLASAKQADDPFAVTGDLAATLKSMKQALIEQLKKDFSKGSHSSLAEARQAVRKLQFVEKLNQEVEQVEEEISDNY